MGDILRPNVRQGLAGTHRRAHRTLARRGPVVAHVALHHQLVFRNNLGNAEGTCQHAVLASDAARLQGGHHHAVFADLDRVGRTDLRAGRVFAMPADVGGRGDGLGAIDEVEIDHGVAAMGVALFTGLHASLAADAARGVHVEFVAVHYLNAPCGPIFTKCSATAQAGAVSALLRRHAETLNSGILLRGSSVRWVRRLALLSSAQ